MSKSLTQFLASLIARKLAKVFGYKVAVLMTCPARGMVAVTHYSLTYRGALEWAGCYATGDAVVITEMFMGKQAQMPVGVRYAN